MRRIAGAILGAILLLAPTAALAIPSLQLYMSNSTYDPVSESWMSYDNPLTLQVLGATTPAWTHTIEDVTLYVSVPQQYYNSGGSIDIQGLPSAPPSPDEVDPVTDLLGNGGRPPDGFGTPLLPPAYPGDT